MYKESGIFIRIFFDYFRNVLSGDNAVRDRIRSKQIIFCRLFKKAETKTRENTACQNRKLVKTLFVFINRKTREKAASQK